MISQRSHVPDELILYPSYSDNMMLRVFGTITPTATRTAIFSGFARPLSELDAMCRDELDRFHALYFALDIVSPGASDTVKTPRKLESDLSHIPQGSFRDMWEEETSRRLEHDVLAFLLGDSSSINIPRDFHRTYAVILARDQESSKWKRIGLVYWYTLHCDVKPDYRKFISFEDEVH